MTTTAEAPTNGNGKPHFNPNEPGVRNSQEAQFWEMTSNAFQNRMSYFQQLLDPRRDLDRECGYPSTYAVGPDFYRQLYDRDPIANRVVQLMPKECWQKTPRVYEDEDSKHVTPFEEAWDNLSSQLAPERSWFQDEEGSLVWEYLRRADEISGIGAFGVILLGLDDGADMRDPVEGAISDKYSRNRDGKKRTTDGKEKTTTNSWRLDPSKLSIATPMPSEEVLDEMVANSLTPPIKDWHEGGSTQLKHVDQAVVHQAKVDPRFVKNADGERWELIRNGNVVTNEIKSGKDVIGSMLGTDAQYFGVSLGPTQYPVEEPIKKDLSLTFLRVFDEALVQIVQYEANIRNPRFGRPVMYRITFNDPREQHGGIGLPVSSMYVHWTRIVHLADTGNGVSSEIFASPRLRPVLNPVLDARKVNGAGAEGYWQSCFAGIVLSTHPQLGGEVNIQGDTKAVVENYVNGLQRWLVLSGMGASTLAPTVVDPTPHSENQIQRICIQLGCPKRVFMGSERGELASSQDDSSWNDRIAHRQNTYVTPRVICPFVDRLILLGVLPEPEGYSIEWPDLDSTTNKERAAIFQTRVTAYAAAIQGNVESIFPPLEMMTQLDDMDEEEAQAILDAATKLQEEEMASNPQAFGVDGKKLPPGTPPQLGPDGKPLPPPPPAPMNPIKLGAGQTMVPHPGDPKAKGQKPFTAPVPKGLAKSPTKNSNPEGHNQYTGGSGHETVKATTKQSFATEVIAREHIERMKKERPETKDHKVLRLPTGQVGYGSKFDYKVSFTKPKLPTKNELTHNFNSLGVCEDCGVTENWCNQYGGTTCKDGSAGAEANKRKESETQKKGLEKKADFVPKKERESKERTDKAHEMVKKILDGGKSKAATKELLSHLSTMTTKELKSVSKEHGLKATGTTKAKLSESLSKKIEGKAATPKEAGIKDFGKNLRDVAQREQATGKPFVGHVIARLIPTGKEETRDGITRKTTEQERWDKLRKGEVSDETLHSILSHPDFQHDHGRMTVAQLKDVIPHVRWGTGHENKLPTSAEQYKASSGKITPAVVRKALEDHESTLPRTSVEPKKAPVDTFRLLPPPRVKGRPARVTNEASDFLFTQKRFDALADVLCDDRVWKGGAKVVRNFDAVEMACFVANSFCPLTTNDTEGEGRWVTMGGTPVFIKGGEITKGPEALKELVKEGHGNKAHDEKHPAGGHTGHTGHIIEDIGHRTHLHLAHDAGDAMLATGSVIAGLKLFGGKIGAKVEHVEHVVAHAIANGVEKGVNKAVSYLPDKAQGPVKAAIGGVWSAAKLGKAAFFASFTAGQSFAERIAKEKGLSNEHAAKLRNTLATADIALAKPAVMLGGKFGVGIAASFVPIASASYIATSAVKNPIATARAAWKAVGSVLPKGGDPLGLSKAFAGTHGTTRNALTNVDYSALSVAMDAHGYDDWYITLLNAALDQTQDAGSAIDAANAAYKAQPTDDSEPQGDDGDWLLNLLPKSKDKPTKNAEDIREYIAQFPDYVANAHVFNEDDQDDDAILEAAALAHADDEWYEALLQTALQETGGNAALAVKFADEYYAANPDGGELDDDEDEFDDDEDFDYDMVDNANPEGCNQYKDCEGGGDFDELMKHADARTMDYPHIDAFKTKMDAMSPKAVKALAAKAGVVGATTKKDAVEKLVRRATSFMESKINTSRFDGDNR